MKYVIPGVENVCIPSFECTILIVQKSTKKCDCFCKIENETFYSILVKSSHNQTPKNSHS